MKIEPNMYVRTKDGKIAKFIKYDEEDKEELITDYYEYSTIWIKDVIEASHNIIDLIEVGDVIKFDITDTDNYADIQGYNCWEISCEEELNGVKEMIEMGSAKLISIVTREQFKAMEYRLGDK